MPLTSTITDYPLPETTLFDLLFGDISEEHADKTAIVDSAGSITYSELKILVEAFAGSLAARGIKKGDVVALHCPNSTTFAVAMHGVLRAGAICTTVASMSTEEDVTKQLQISGAKMMLTASSIGWAGKLGAQNAGISDDMIIGLSGTHGVGEIVHEGHRAPDVEVHPDDVAVIPFSSGTTGLPKGVQLTHRNLTCNVVQAALATEDALTVDTPTLTVLPFFHIYGMTALLNLCLYRRTTQYTMAEFDFAAFLHIAQQYKVEFAFIAPPIAVALAKHPAVDKFDLSSMRVIFSGAAPLANELAKAVEKRIGCTVGQGFGMTETSPATHIRVNHEAPLDSIGRAVANTEYKIVDVSKDDLPEIDVPSEGHSEAGELWIRGPQVMLGYINNEEATRQTITEDNWLRTGDMAELDPEGNVYVVDRFKELIKYKGYQVAPAELEDLLLQHPKVDDSACIGVTRHSDGEEIPKAFIVLAEGTEPSDELANDIMEFVENRVAGYKKVRAVEFIDEIPKSKTGKILRRNLK
ncbi:AMP-binding protein [Corynebacterium sp. TAE3-ERU12]|uniref:AMP-binding protein n=1 Tax=Corynebacterium sp. TAE3-ERU12 TaxID=2849491 RepID=UPI001C4803FD|nr:AMP-binding protein [Corynebacterium sp. TAE3-ERU12]MBV7294870.1 AMP-binding protein [Corynebacterium sp. TAE3-ERU12]